MQVAVVVVDVADVWRVVAVLFQDGECNTTVDAHGVDGYEAFVAGLLLHDGELSITEVFRTDAHKVGIPLTKIATKHEHITHSA